jgi:DNA-binding CsgD family transcriptional regulator
MPGKMMLSPVSARASIASLARSGGAETMRGRDAEWQAVRELLRHTRHGIGGVLLVEGERGIGKSRLLRESEREADAQGFVLATGSADQLWRQMPLEALAALHRPSGRLTEDDGRPDLPGSPQLRIRELQARLRQLAAAAPVLVSLDDLQWANPDTLLALRVLQRELARHPLAWILARSDVGQDRGAELLFRLLEKDGATRLALAPLGDEAVTALLTDILGAPPDQRLLAWAADTAGNPWLLTELVHGLCEDNSVQVTEDRARLISARLPQRVHRVARQGLDDLTRQARQLLETAAVLGRSFRLEDAAEMLDQTPAALLPAIEEVVGAGIVIAADDEFSFRRKLAWRAVATTIPRPARTALHRQFGEILLRRGASAAQAAEHLLEAAHSGDPTSLTGLDRAAAEILGTSPQTAATLALRAAELTRSGDQDALARSVAAAEALTAAGRLDQAAGLVHDMLARPLPADLEARLRCALSAIRCMGGEARRAMAEAQAVLDQPQLPAGLRDQALITHLQAAAGLRDHQAARRAATPVLAAPGRYGRQVVAAALVARAMASWDEGRAAEGLSFLRDAARHGTVVSPDARHAQPLLALAGGLVDLRRFDEAATVIRAADIEVLQGIPSAAVPGILRARMHLAEGRLCEAAAEGEAALAIAGAFAAHGFASVAHSVLGVIALRRGDLEAAAQHIASRRIPAPPVADAYARAETTVAEAQIAEARNGPAAALGRIREVCADLPARRGVLFGASATSAWLVRTALAADEPGLAARIARVASTLARDNPQVPALTAAAAHSAGLLRRDPARLAHAAAQHRDQWARASAAEDLGVLLAASDADRAVEHMSEALDGYAVTGAAIDLARVRRRLRRLGVRRRHWALSAGRAAAGWESLTETERITSELVAQGLSNQQAADRMYISVHTIAFHLRQIYRKLNISSRVELARIVMEQGEPGPGLAPAAPRARFPRKEPGWRWPVTRRLMCRRPMTPMWSIENCRRRIVRLEGSGRGSCSPWPAPPACTSCRIACSVAWARARCRTCAEQRRRPRGPRRPRAPRRRRWRRRCPRPARPGR